MNRVPRCLLAAAVLSAVLFLGGCIHQAGGIAPSNVPIEGRRYHVVGEVVASDSAVRLLGILPLSGSNSTAQAMRSAMAKRDADALIDITVENYAQYWILFTRHVTSVRATAIKFY